MHTLSLEMAFRETHTENAGYSIGSVTSVDTSTPSVDSSQIKPLPPINTLIKPCDTNIHDLSAEVKRRITFLFVLAHPDDEASHLLTIKFLVDEGFPVHLLWVSYGDGSTKPETKIRESKKVMSAIPGVQLTFLPNSVNEFTENIFRTVSKETREAAIRKVIGQLTPEIQRAGVVITNAFEGGHILHDFTNLVVQAIARTEEKDVLEIPQYSLKSFRDILVSLFKSTMAGSFGAHTFFNAGQFREGPPKEKNLRVRIDDATEVRLPSEIELTAAGTIEKAGLIRLYESQWESVFSKLLEVVEFNGAEGKEYLRRPRKIPGLTATLMHLEKFMKSLLSDVIHPRKLYQVKRTIEALVRQGKAKADVRKSATDPE